MFFFSLNIPGFLLAGQFNFDINQFWVIYESELSNVQVQQVFTIQAGALFYVFWISLYTMLPLVCLPEASEPNRMQSQKKGTEERLAVDFLWFDSIMCHSGQSTREALFKVVYRVIFFVFSPLCFPCTIRGVCSRATPLYCFLIKLAAFWKVPFFGAQRDASYWVGMCRYCSGILERALADWKRQWEQMP